MPFDTGRSRPGSVLACIVLAAVALGGATVAGAERRVPRHIDEPRLPAWEPADSTGKKPGNAKPKVAVSVTPASGTGPRAVSVDAAGSLDPDGMIAFYSFDFGDGSVAGPQASPHATHLYEVGTWVLRVTVTDDAGDSAADSFMVSAEAPANHPPRAALAVRQGTLDPALGFLPLNTDPAAVFSSPSVSRPPYLGAVLDPTFGTRVTRLAGAAGEPLPPALGGVWASDARHHYSKDQPWNADNTLLMLENKSSPRRIALDGDTYEPRHAGCPNYDRGDDRWHPSRRYANVRINARGSVLSWFNVVTCTEVRRWTLPFAVRAIGDGEGNPSLDGRYLALCDSSRMFVVDMDPQPPYAPYPNVRIGPVVDFLADCALPECRLGWVSVSPSGKYVVCKYAGDYPRVFDMDPATLALTPRPMPESSPRCHGTAAGGFLYDLGHCDMTLNPFDGNEDVLIGQEHCGQRGAVIGGRRIGGVVMARLRDGAITPLTDPANEAYPHHVSTQNVARPGWAYVGYYPDPGKRFSDEIVAVKLDGSLAVERWAHKHSDTHDCYRCEAHAVPSRDGRRVVWASNWAIDCVDCGPPTDLKPYVADARIGQGVGATWVSPARVTADASASWDEDGHVASYTFDFGDGVVIGPQAEANASHAYTAGTWTLAVTATDDDGAIARATTVVRVLPNLITNPSFETSTAGWTSNAAISIARAAGGRDGDSCLEIQGPATTATFGANDSPNAVATVAAAGARYRFAAWVRSAASRGQGKLRVREYLAGVQQGPTVFSRAVALSPLWQPVSLDYVALQAGSTLDFQVVDAPLLAGEIFETDEVSVVALPGSGSWVVEGQSLPTPEGPPAEDVSRAAFAGRLFPNPLKPRATLRFTTTRPGPCRVEVHDLQGRAVRTLLDAPELGPGLHDLEIGRQSHGDRLRSGVYFYRVLAAEGVLTGKLLIVD